MKLVLAFGDFIFGDEEQGFVVGGPGDFIDALELFGEQLAGAEVLDLQSILAVTGGVGGVGEQVIVVAGQRDGDIEEFVPLGQCVYIENDFLPGLEGSLLTAVNRVILS